MPLDPIVPRGGAFFPKVQDERTLRAGSHGDDVKRLQEQLNQLGYTAGNADGTFGPSTRKALLAFQKAQNVPQDGVFGDKSRAAMTSAIATHTAAAAAAAKEAAAGTPAAPGTSPQPTSSRARKPPSRTMEVALPRFGALPATAPAAPAAPTQPLPPGSENVNAQFPNLTRGSDGPEGKKGRDFIRTARPDGTTATLSFNASAHSDYDGGGVTGGADGTTQASTTYKFPDGKSVDPTSFSSYVLPCQTSVTWKDKKGKWHSGEPPAHSDPAAPAIPGARSPFYDNGVRPLDLARITTPTGDTAYAVLADAGPSFAIGEISPAAAKASNLQASMPPGETWGPNCGFDMTWENGAVNYNLFPGSGAAVSRLYTAKANAGVPFTDADIQRLGALAESRADSGQPITDEEIAALVRQK